MGSGDFFDVYAISTRGLESFVLRVPKGSSIRQQLQSRDFRVREVDPPHPWADRDNVGVAVATLRNGSRNAPEAEVQCRVAGKACADHFREPWEAIEELHIFFRSGSSAQLAITLPLRRLVRENRELFANYDAFQARYAEYVHALAQLHPSAYDEVAQMILEGHQQGISLDLRHGNNILLVRVEEDPSQRGRFGLVDVEANRPPDDLRPMGMKSFLAALLINNWRFFEPSNAASFVQDSELRPGFVKDLDRVISKCRTAQQRWPIPS